MSKVAQHLLNLAGHFEKIAVDIPQTPDFDSDYKKWKEMKDPTPKDEEGAYEKWLKDNSIEEGGPSGASFSPEPEGDGISDEERSKKWLEEHRKLLLEPNPEDDLTAFLPKDSGQPADTYIRTAKEKLDPKAKVRNRGTVCVPASSAKDKKDHFPINSESQARNALARVHQYDKVPSWYSGSLKSLQELVSRKVHSKYKGIGKSEKKSSVDHLIVKYADGPQAFYTVVSNYDTGADILRDFAAAMKMSADLFAKESDLDDPQNRKTYDVLLREASLVLNLMPEMEALDREMHEDSQPYEQEEPPPSGEVG